jgi:hypothetical protein
MLLVLLLPPPSLLLGWMLLGLLSLLCRVLTLAHTLLLLAPPLLDPELLRSMCRLCACRTACSCAAAG